MQNIVIGLEKRLENIKDQNSDFSALWESWCTNKRLLESFLQIIIGAFPHYSLHDASHSKSIINNIEMVLGNTRINQLGATDIWLLLNSAYAHDIGMITQSTLREEWDSPRFQDYLTACQQGNGGEELKRFADIVAQVDQKIGVPIETHFAVIYLLAEYQRRNHAKSAAEAIISPSPKIDLSGNGLIPRRFIEWIAKIIQSHGENFSFILGLSQIDNGLCRDYIHPRFIAALLCLGDNLDMDNSRFHPYSNILVDGMPDSSYTHYQKHESIRQLCITPECIEIVADFGIGNPYYHDAYRSLRQWCDWLKLLVENITVNWNQIVPQEIGGSAPFLKDIQYFADGKRIKPELAELRFHISQERAFELIEGAGLYDSDDVFLRELLQNAIDASKIQFWNDVHDHVFSENEINYNWGEYGFQPYHIKNIEVLNRYRINVEFEPFGEYGVNVKFVDQGTGMTEDDILNLSEAGSSYNKQQRKKRIQSMPKWLRPTGNFGIGLQSLFLINKKFRCILRSRQTGEKYQIDFTSRSDDGYLNVYTLDQQINFGTSFEIQYKNDMHINPNFFDSEISKEAYSLYNSYDYFLNKKPENSKAKTGALYLYTLLTRYMGRSNAPFPVSIGIAGSEKKHEYNDLFLEGFYRGNVDENGIVVEFDVSSLTCHIWNSQKEYYSKISVLRENRRGGICFKNIPVPNSLISDTEAFGIALNLFGWEAKEVMQLNREKLRRDFSVMDIVSESKQIWRETFVKNFDAALEVVSTQSKNDEGYLWYTCIMTLLSNPITLNDREKQCIDKLFSLPYDHMMQGYRFLPQEDCYRKVKDISAREIIMPIYKNEAVIKIPFFVCHADSFGNQSISEDFLNSFIDEIREYTMICNEEQLKNLTDQWDDCMALYDNFCNLSFNVKTNKPICATKIPEQKFLKNLYHYINNNDMRIIITNCIFPYEKLALDSAKTKSLPTEFFLSTNHIYYRFTSPKMIVPVTEWHISNLQKLPISEVEFVDSIVSDPQFGKIIDFTYDNQYCLSHFPKQDIRACYIQLIRDIWGVFPKSESVAECH